MAGMAWTLHPALFYEKYGTVLVQLWESGEFATIFGPVRRLSKTISGKITSMRLHGSVAALPKTEAEADAGALTLTDESVATVDEAMSRVNREPGDTSPEPSTSQQNELAFQGDIYTQMRRSRRQRGRLLKIRETREKFLEGGSSSSGSEFGRKRRGLHARRGSIMAFKKDKGFRKATGGGTPLTDMEGVAPTRAVVIDVSTGSPASEGGSEDEDDAAGATGKPSGPIKPEELLADNDSLQTFRDVCRPRKRSHGSPPPDMREPSDWQTETASLASAAAADQVGVCDTLPPKKLAEPFAAAKSPRKSALHKRKASRRASVVSSRSVGEQATKSGLEKYPPIATMGFSSAVAGKESPPEADFSPAASLLSTKQPITSDKLPAPPFPAESVTKKDKAKRRKPKAGSRKKKAREKTPKSVPGPGEVSPVLPEDSYTDGDVDSGAVSEDKPRRKHETAGVPSRDKVRSRVARHLIARKESSSIGKIAPSQTAEAVRRGKSGRAASLPATSVRAPGDIVDTEFHEDRKRLQDVSKTTPSAAGAAVVQVADRGARLSAKAIKRDSVADLKTAPPLGLEQRASKREERGAEAKPSAQTSVNVPRSSEALETSAGASRGVGVRKRHDKKHRIPKSLATAAEASSGAPTSAEDVEPGIPSALSPGAASSHSAANVFDEIAAVHHHRRRSHGTSRRHAKEGGRRRHSRKTKEDRPVDSAQLATGGDHSSAALGDVAADVGVVPSRVTGSTAATARKDIFAESTRSEVSAPSARCHVMPPTADVTLTGTDTTISVGGKRRPPRATTVIKGDDVTVHVDLTSRDRAAMFWPFGRRGDKKKK